tara:strand:+ start:2810 stop:7039 length:4230 start_codon:yes stop_codon:yes gene_type:complete
MSRHTKTITRSFAGGEMSPEMFGRMDDVKYQAGAATLLNCIPRPVGAATRRSGTRLVREIRDSDNTAHLFPFVFSPTQSLVIEGSRATIGGLSGGYFRFHTNGGTLLYSHPDMVKPAKTNSAAFRPFQAVTCTVANPMKVQLNGHGLSNGDQVQFISSSRTMPGGVSNYTNYYVKEAGTNDFEISTTKAGSSVISNTHAGYYPSLFNWAKWRNSTEAQQSISLSEHRFKNKDRVVLTMWPVSTSPTVTFSGTTFQPTKVAGGRGVYMSTNSAAVHQVMFVADDPNKISLTTAGATLPSGIEEGRLYWATGHSNGSWTISKTFGGAPHNVGTGGVTTAASKIRMTAMPSLDGGSLGANGNFGCLVPYYVIATASPNIIKLETSVGAGQVVNGGLQFGRYGTGDVKFHYAHEVGDIFSFDDAAGGLRNFYARREWWEPEIEDDRNVITLEMHSQSGPRIPGSGYRTRVDQAEHWRELPGRTTGGPVEMTPREYTGSGNLTIDAVYGGHGFSTGQAVSIVDGVSASGITADQVYYAVRISASQIKLATSYSNAVAGTVIDGPSSASPIHGSVLMQGWVTFDTTNHKVGWIGHGLANGDTVVFSQSAYASASIQGGLELDKVYYVRGKTTNDFRVSATHAGPLIDFTGSAGSKVAAVGNAIYEVPHEYSEDEISKVTTTQSNDVMTLASRDHPVKELRRISSTKWATVEPEFKASAAVPGVIYESATVSGEGMKITGTATVSGGLYDGWKYFKTYSQHTFTHGNPVYIEGLPSSGAGSLADGYYMVGAGDEQNSVWNIFLTEVENSVLVNHGGDKASGLDGRIRYGTQGEDRSQKYVVTSIDKNNEESSPNDPLTVNNNLNVSGASNTIGWGASLKAIRYRVYKELGGLYGLIGETDELTFKDDNIGPDLGVSPPIPDTSLREESKVTFDVTANSVSWASHGLTKGMPVVFKTSDQMPGVTEGKAYYVMNPGDDEFQITDNLETEAIATLSGTDTGTHVAIAGNFPSAVSYFEGRRVFAGSRALPQDIWMTASGTESDLSYSIPTVDSDRIYFRIASREGSAVRHLLPMSQLVLLSDTTEYRLTPANDDILTPSSISVRPQSFVGADYPHPALVNNTAVFAAARGGHVRELGYNRDVLGYLTGDLSIRAAHLFDGFTIKDQAYAKAPIPIVWCVSSSGKLLGLTYIPEESVGAWHQHTTPASGEFESVVSIPEGDEDAVYVVVKRVINGVTKRYVERFADEYRGDTASLPDAYFVDCGLTYSGASTTSVAGLDHLEGESVSYLADGVAGTGTISSGTLTLTKAATKVHVGLGYTSQIQTLPLTMMRVDAFGTGRTKNVNQVWVRAFQSGAFKAGPTASNLRSSLTPSAGSLLTDLVQVTLPASWDDDGQVVIQQDTPLPLTVSGLTIEVASGG